jgi:hypothetical protein
MPVIGNHSHLQGRKWLQVLGGWIKFPFTHRFTIIANHRIPVINPTLVIKKLKFAALAFIHSKYAFHKPHYIFLPVPVGG